MYIYVRACVCMLQFYFNLSSEDTRLVWILSKSESYTFRMNFSAAMLCLTLLFG